MDRFLGFLVLTGLFFQISAIYLTNSTKSRIETNPAVWTEEGIWGPLLEEWSIGSQRKGKVIQLPPNVNAYVIQERNDSISEELPKESKISATKIVSSPQYKPPSKLSGTQVSETDLYLLGAIEKLVYRADFMEKRLRRVEEMLYYVTAGNRIDQPEPCPGNFTRISTNCYLFSTMAGREYDWKAASKQCKRQGGVLAEMETIEENQDIISHIQNTDYLRGKDFWTGGLNPGLLWIWSNSARPVAAPGSASNKKNPSASITGDGRCLRLAYNPALRSYAYRGTDCSVRYSYICELPENTSSNEIKKIGRKLNIFN